MKLSSFATFAGLAYTAVAAVTTVTLNAESSDQDVNGKAITSLHEGAGFNYLFLSEHPQKLSLDDSNDSIFFEAAGFRWNLTISGSVVSIGVLQSSWYTSLDDDYIAVNGSTEGFYACKNTNDPYNYSKDSYQVTFPNGEAPSGCKPIKLKVSKHGNPSHSHSHSPGPSESPSHSYPHHSHSPSPSHGYHNTTITKLKTVTDYVTYCPGPTTITVTTCTNDVCNPSTVTVSSETTLTVTGECVVPTSYTPPPEQSESPSTPTNEGSTSAATTPGVSTVEEGAAGNNLILSTFMMAVVGAAMIF
ncbi:uncharacterized protein PRCAT00005158001 [Priceomyces carsonii]|uniref:uncharacterized protein n=1 Tax=Priceomyces carsonii TaxID=28549 RepID=UPI002ED81AAD|nr:unnamed protein product [Priceomyces carsonii]